MNSDGERPYEPTSMDIILNIIFGVLTVEAQEAGYRAGDDD